MAGNDGVDGNAKTDSANEDHHALYNLVFVIFGGLVTSVVEFALLWSENHHLAFLAMAASLSLLSIYQTRIWGWDINWIIAGVFFWFVGAQILNGIIGPIPPPRDVEIIGTLQPANEPTPSNACDAPTGPPFIGLEVGGAAVGIGGTPDQAVASLAKEGTLILLGKNVRVLTENDKVTVLKTKACPLVSVQKTDNGLFVDASIYDDSGALIAGIKNNAIDAIQGQRAGVERNGDLSTLVIKDTKETELLWVRFLNPKAIQIRGIFRCPQGQTREIDVTNDGVRGFLSPTMPIVERNICTATGSIDFP